MIIYVNVNSKKYILLIAKVIIQNHSKISHNLNQFYHL